MTIPSGLPPRFLPPPPTHDRAQLPLLLPLPARPAPLPDAPVAGSVVAGTPAQVPPRGVRPTLWQMTRIGVAPALDGEEGAPSRAALTIQRHVASPSTELDRVLAGERLAEPVTGARVLLEPALWFSGAYADVAQRIAERHPQVWLCLAGSLPPRRRLTVAQRDAVRRFVDGTGTTRLAVLAGDAHLQALVRAARLERRLLAALAVLLGAAVLVALGR